MRKFMIATSVVVAVGLAACDGPRENAAGDAAELRAEGAKAQAEALEGAGQINAAQEEAMSEAAKDKADAMEDMAEAADEAVGQ